MASPTNSPKSEANPTIITSAVPPGFGGWTPSLATPVLTGGGAAILTGVAQYLQALGAGHGFTWAGFGSAVLTSLVAFGATFLGVRSAGPRDLP